MPRRPRAKHARPDHRHIKCFLAAHRFSILSQPASQLKRFRQTACSDTIHRFVSFSSEVCVTVSRRAVLSLIVGLVSLFLAALPAVAQKTKPPESAKPGDAPAVANLVDPKAYGGLKWRRTLPFWA